MFPQLRLSTFIELPGLNYFINITCMEEHILFYEKNGKICTPYILKRLSHIDVIKYIASWTYIPFIDAMFEK